MIIATAGTPLRSHATARDRPGRITLMTISRGPAIDGRMLDAANKGADGDDDSVLDLDAQAIVRQESAMDEQPGNNGAGWAARASHFRSGGVPEVDHEVGEASMIQVDVDNLFPELGSEDSEEIGAGAAAATPPLATDVAPPAAPGVAAAPEAQQPAVDVAETGDDAVRGVPREPDASAQPRQQRTGPATRWSLIYRHVFMGCTLDRVKETGRPIQTAPALWQQDMGVIADATLAGAREFEAKYGKEHFGRNTKSSNPTVADSLKLGMSHVLLDGKKHVLKTQKADALQCRTLELKVAGNAFLERDTLLQHAALAEWATFQLPAKLLTVISHEVSPVFNTKETRLLLKNAGLLTEDNAEWHNRVIPSPLYIRLDNAEFLVLVRVEGPYSTILGVLVPGVYAKHTIFLA